MTPKEARQAAGLSLRAMAKRCECSSAYICQIENGKRPASLRVSDAFEAACDAGPLEWPTLHKGEELQRENRRLRDKVDQLNKLVISHAAAIACGNYEPIRERIFTERLNRLAIADELRRSTEAYRDAGVRLVMLVDRICGPR